MPRLFVPDLLGLLTRPAHHELFVYVLPKTALSRPHRLDAYYVRKRRDVR